MAKKSDWSKVLTESWVSSNMNLSESDAEKALINAEFEIKQLNHDKEHHDQLAAAKELVKDLNSGFSSGVKYEKAKIEFLLEQIENIRYSNTHNKAI